VPIIGHCQACTLWVKACQDDVDVSVRFASLCHASLKEFEAGLESEPDVIKRWFTNLQFNPGADSVSDDVCALDWVADRLRIYVEDPYREVIARWYDGDHDAFDQLYATTRSTLVAKVARVVGSEAEDLVEIFFVELYESWAQGLPRYTPYRGAFIPYAFRCITRRAYTHVNRRSRQHELAVQKLESSENRKMQGVVDFTLDVETIIDATPLTGDERAALELSADGWTGDEIAETLQMSPATVTRRLASAFGKLARQMRECTSADHLIVTLRELTMNHKERAAAVFLNYALHELDIALQELGLERLTWPAKYEAASQRAAELYKQFAKQSENHPVCVLILKHAVEPWGARLWEALGDALESKTVRAQGEM
jgi:RNA polymerase sigma factor (sigma-70 family)